MSTTIDDIGVLLAQALLPLGEIAGQPEIVVRALGSLGFAPPANIDFGAIVSLDPSDVIEKLRIVQRSTPAEQNDASIMSGRYAALISAVAELTLDIGTFAEGLPTALAAAGDYADKSRIAEQLPRRLLDLLLVQALGQVSPPAAFLLRTIGVFGFDSYPAEPATYQVAHRRTVVRYERFKDLFEDPAQLFVKEYGWSTPTFDSETLLSNLGLLFQSFGVRPGLRKMPQAVEEALTGQAIPNAANDPSPQLLVALTTLGAAMPVDVSVSLHRLRPTAAGASDAGLELAVLLAGEASVSVPLSTRLSLQLDANLDLGAGVGIALRPTGAELRTGFLTGGPPGMAAGGRFGAGIHLRRADGKPTQILVAPGGSLIEANDIKFEAGCVLAAGAEPDPYIAVAIVGGRIAVTLGGADGFLSSVLPSAGISSKFDIQVRWTRSQGIRFDGSDRLEITIPAHQAVGPLQIDSIEIGIGAATGGLQLIAAVSGGLELGPLHATIDRVGVQGNLQFVAGNLGNANLALLFQPPSGIGLALDTAAIRGGGGLQIHPDMYSGELQLCISQVIDLTAIGIINTKLPGGAAGFALLLLITAKFQPIQLGYGFTLNGVGGLAAFNHSMDQQALGDGVRNHTLDSILFPTNPVANANKIISDLQRVFPVTEGRFVFAPMVEIGWGGSVLLIDVALVLDLPSPLRLSILGRMHLLLPPATAGAKGDAAKVVVINLDVQGSLDLDQNAISVDAFLYDSRLALFPITGGMAMRIRWGAQPQFLFALGGFNPRFTPPPGFPPLDRVGIQMRYDKGGVRAGLCLTSYFAVTTNTLQFGARIDAYAEVSIAKLAGYLGFDALVDMVPFHVILDLYGGVSVEAFGFKFACDLLLTLAAFDPVTGDGHVTIDFFGKHEAPIHFSIGDAKPLPALPVADALHELMNALGDVANWSAGVQAGAGMVVNLRPPAAAEVTASAGKPLAHPLARLSVRQRVLPFKVALQRFGAATPAQPGPFDIATLTLGSAAAAAPAATAALRDDFARGQFLVLSDDDKLCAPQFESFVCGYDGLGTEGARIATPQVAEFSYDTRVIDDRAQPAKALLPVVVSFDYMRRVGQVGALPAAAAARYAAPPKGIKVSTPKWKSVATDHVDANAPDTFDTYTQAQAHRRAQPGAGRQQVVESFELA